MFVLFALLSPCCCCAAFPCPSHCEPKHCLLLLLLARLLSPFVIVFATAKWSGSLVEEDLHGELSHLKISAAMENAIRGLEAWSSSCRSVSPLFLFSFVSFFVSLRFCGVGERRNVLLLMTRRCLLSYFLGLSPFFSCAQTGVISW